VNAKARPASQAEPASTTGFFAGRFCPNFGANSEGSPMFLDAVFFLADAVLNLLWWAVMLAVIVQMLIQFGVLDTRNRVVWTVADFLYRVTEPLFSRLRRVLPNFGPVDLAPLAVLLLISAGQIVLGAARRSLMLNGLYF
jgi:YggT family protein